MATGATRPRNHSTTRFITNKKCPFAQKVWIALEVSRVPYQLHEISLYGPNGKPDWFWELNPKGTVPVLECQGGTVVVPDSDLILDYIAQGGVVVVDGGTALQVSDQDTLSRIKEWRKTLVQQVIPIGRTAVQQGGGTNNNKKLKEVLKHMNDKVVGPFLCGDQVTIADCAVFPFLWRIDKEFGPLDATQGCGKLRTWLDTCSQMDAFSKTIQTNWWWWW